jgi:hypothetical protein
MGMSSLNCLVCGRDMMSEWSYKDTPEWMQHVVVFMPDDVKIAGKFTGYSAVETGETIWSKYVDRESHDREDDLEGISIIRLKDRPFVEEHADGDPGYLSMHWWEGSVNHPSCYHRDCWEAVGSPEGFRGASLRAHDQGFGNSNSLFRTGGFKGIDDDDEFWGPPDPGETAMKWWAINSVCHFIYNMGSWSRSMAHAEEQVELHQAIDRINEMVKTL